MLIKAESVINILDTDIYKEKDLNTYRWLNGKLIYLACRIRPDIAFVISQLSRHNTDLWKDHIQADKRLFWYLKGTINLSLIYGQITEKDSPRYNLIGYADNNFAGDPEDRKLLMGYCFFLNSIVVLWKSTK